MRQRLDELGKELTQQRDLRRQPLERALLLERLERRQGGGAGERIAGVGMTVEEGPEVVVVAEEALEDALGGERRRQRQIAPG